MKNIFHYIKHHFTLFFIGAFALWLGVQAWINPDSVMQSLYYGLNKLSYPFVLIMCLLSLCNYGLRTIRWYVLVKHYVPEYTMKMAFWDYFSGFAFIMTPAKAGELIRSYYIKERFGISTLKSIIPSLYDRIYDFLALLIIFIVGSFFYDFSYITLILVLGIGVISVMLFVRAVWFIPVIKLCFYPFKHSKSVQKHCAKIMLFLHHCCDVRDFSLRFYALLLGFLGWCCEFYAFYLLLHLFDIHINIFASAFIFVASTLMGVLFMTPGGTGTAEGIMTGFIMSYHVPLLLAVFITSFIRLTTLWFAVILGMITVFLRNMLYKNERFTYKQLKNKQD